MLFHRADSLLEGGFTLENYLNIADALCHSQLEVSPVFECVKVFVRLNEDSEFVYARHKFDLGSANVDKAQLASRIKDPQRQQAVISALTEVEERCLDTWPFSAGSATWVLLEILHPDIKLASSGNNPTVIFRTANRISSKGNLSETTLTKSLFSRFQESEYDTSGEYSFSFNPTIRLKNTSGSGIYTKFREEHESVAFLAGDPTKKLDDIPSAISEHYRDSFFEMVGSLLEYNFDISLDTNPGFMFILNENLYRVQGREFSKKRKEASQCKNSTPLRAPLPFGFRK